MSDLSALEKDGWCIDENKLKKNLDLDPSLSHAELRKLLLDSDIKEFGGAHVNPDWAKQHEFCSHKILQIQKIRNVSAPRINELCKLAPRLFKVTLTDGYSTVLAVEWARCECLSADTPPGTKLLVLGRPAVCCGVVLLGSDSVRVLGGHVTALVDKWLMNKTFGSLQTRVLSEQYGGPPAWVPFGKKIAALSHDEADFKSLKKQNSGDVNETDASAASDTAFDKERGAKIAQLRSDMSESAAADHPSNTNVKRFSNTGVKQVVDVNLQAVMSAGFSWQDAQQALHSSSNNVGQAIRSLKNHGGGSDTTAPVARDEMRGSRHSRRRRTRDDDEPALSRPANTVTLSDFVHLGHRDNSAHDDVVEDSCGVVDLPQNSSSSQGYTGYYRGSMGCHNYSRVNEESHNSRVRDAHRIDAAPSGTGRNDGGHHGRALGDRQAAYNRDRDDAVHHKADSVGGRDHGGRGRARRSGQIHKTNRDDEDHDRRGCDDLNENRIGRDARDRDYRGYPSGSRDVKDVRTRDRDQRGLNRRQDEKGVNRRDYDDPTIGDRSDRGFHRRSDERFDRVDHDEKGHIRDCDERGDNIKGYDVGYARRVDERRYDRRGRDERNHRKGHDHVDNKTARAAVGHYREGRGDRGSERGCDVRSVSKGQQSGDRDTGNYYREVRRYNYVHASDHTDSRKEFDHRGHHSVGGRRDVHRRSSYHQGEIEGVFDEGEYHSRSGHGRSDHGLIHGEDCTCDYEPYDSTSNADVYGRSHGMENQESGCSGVIFPDVGFRIGVRRGGDGRSGVCVGRDHVEVKGRGHIVGALREEPSSVQPRFQSAVGGREHHCSNEDDISDGCSGDNFVYGARARRRAAGASVDRGTTPVERVGGDHRSSRAHQTAISQKARGIPSNSQRSDFVCDVESECTSPTANKSSLQTTADKNIRGSRAIQTHRLSHARSHDFGVLEFRRGGSARSAARYRRGNAH